MALPATNVIEVETGASDTANGGTFDPSNTNMATDLAATGGSAASPAVSSVSYTFVSSDIGAWLFLKSGTNWFPGWYKIVSVVVSPNSASLSAGASSAVSYPGYGVNASVGIASVASPTAGTWTIDYSQQTTAAFAYTDLASAGAGLTVTSAAKPFGKNHVANGLQIASGTNFTAGFYSVSSVSGTTATLVGAANSSTGVASSGVGGLGGALATWGGLFTLLAANVVADMRSWIKQGSTYAVAASPSALGTSQRHSFFGYGTVRGDGGQPTIQISANSVTLCTASAGSPNLNFSNILFDGNSKTSSAFLVPGAVAIVSLYNVGLTNFTGTGISTGAVQANRVLGTGNTGTLFSSAAPSIIAESFFNNNSGLIWTATGSLLVMTDTIIGNHATTAPIHLGANAGCHISNVTFHGKAGSLPANFIVNQGNFAVDYEGNFFRKIIFSGCSGAARFDNTETYRCEVMSNCATFNVGSLTSNATSLAANPPVTCSVDPHVNAAAGDFSLNNTAGGGALVRGLTITLPGALTVSRPDAGAAQHVDAGGIRPVTFSGGLPS